MSQEQPTLGQLLSGNERRDAIHVAIAPIQAADALRPGEHVGLSKSGRAVRQKEDGTIKLIGIVDPFLTVKHLFPNEWFYLWLYPNTVTSLRHVWTHPAFNPKPQEKP